MYYKNMVYLTSERQGHIDNVINDLQLRSGLSYPENDLLEIVKAAGAEVYFTVLPKIEGKDVDGAVKWTESIGKIYINDAYSSTRKTFTLAHELGHYLLHEGQEKLRFDVFDYSSDSKIVLEETEANYFAASLLMPKYEISRLWDITHNISAIAPYFGVSESAVRTRIRWLHLSDVV